MDIAILYLRRNIYMVELTIEITNFCENNCNFCSSDAKPSGEHLSFERIKEFLSDYERQNYIDPISRINISGGEPLAHPDFYKILKYCKRITRNVWVYTNAIERLAYNSHVVTEIKVVANVCIIPGEDNYIPQGRFSVHLLKFVPQGRGKHKSTPTISASGNFNNEHCSECNQPTLLADGCVVTAPCRKTQSVLEGKS
jgi:hypothetical protein